jgi:hypothetical protein
MSRPPLWLLALILPLVALPSAALAENGVWKGWTDALHRQCPDRRVDRICDSCYDELIGGFSQTIPASMNRKLDQFTSRSHRCDHEMGGLSCEMYLYLDAVERFGLLKRFTAFGCKTYRCEEPAMCTSTLPSPPH